ncbi:MAG TPA: AGE family epimerase/isomerase [Caulobacteraceae bacterium]|jgi:mannose-6-phosphate isomerase|nr:AGE family epimerase/isomerase [Caulobacteraceae bacterium]
MKRSRDAGRPIGLEQSRAATGRLTQWLTRDALPLWRTLGADASGYVSQIALDGAPVPAPARLRVQARQAHVYALAARMGWSTDVETASRLGLAAVRAARRDSGLYQLTPYGPFDGMGLIYDQAFVLLALASCQAALGEATEAEALALAERIAAFAQAAGGYGEAPGLAVPLFANPNMHLFEAFQAWSRASPDPRWQGLAAGQARLALERLIDFETGVLLESYDADWQAPARPVLWPGHLYEWGWLLLDWAEGDAESQVAGLRLIEIAEQAGVDAARGVAIFALDGELRPVDRGGRLWAQTERLRACVRVAALTGEAAWWNRTAQACGTLEAYLQVPTPGLWRDWMDEAGAFREEPAPASTLYHIVGAIAELVRQTSEGT